MSKAPTKTAAGRKPVASKGAVQKAEAKAAPNHDHSAHSHETDHLHHEAHNHGSMKGYLIGFGLSVVLTAIPFWLVMSGVFAPQTTGGIIMAFAVAQIVVHMIFFLHMNSRSEGGWTILALIFTLILVVIALTGSLWVMYHLNTNMMPEHGMNMNPAP